MPPTTRHYGVPIVFLFVVVIVGVALAVASGFLLLATHSRSTMVHSEPTPEERLADAAQETRTLVATLERAGQWGNGPSRALLASSRSRLSSAIEAADDDSARLLADSVDYAHSDRAAQTLDALVARTERLAAESVTRRDRDTARSRAASTTTSLMIVLLLSLAVVALSVAVILQLRSFDRSLRTVLPSWVPGVSAIDRIAFLAGRERRSLTLAESHRLVLDEARVRADEEYLRRIATERALEDGQDVIRTLKIRTLQDEMTLLWRKTYFLARVRASLVALSDHETPFAVLALDLDDFKRINDVYGHKAGDAAIIDTARLLVDSCRDQDVVCRAGGDEFLVLLPDTNGADADEIAHRIISRIKEHRVSAVIRDDELVEFTLATSIGLFDSTEADRDLITSRLRDNVTNDDNDAISSVVKRADRAASLAKARGKGCVVRYQPDIERELDDRLLPPEWDTFRRYVPNEFARFSDDERRRFIEVYTELLALTLSERPAISTDYLF